MSVTGSSFHSSNTQWRNVSTRQLTADLKRCGLKRDLHQGELLHEKVIECGCETNIYVASALISMYSKCASMNKARNVFENMTHRDVVSWTSLILGYMDNGQYLVALDVFDCMDCTPDRVTFVAAFKACAGLASGGKLDKRFCLCKGLFFHRQVRQLGLEGDIVVASSLVDMYSKCGDMLQARCVFEEMACRDVVSWNVLMFGYLDNGEARVALDVFGCMDCAPNQVTLVAVLKAYGSLVNSESFDQSICVQKVVDIHKQAMELGFHRDVIIANILVDTYSKCGEMNRAHEVFEKIAHPDAVSWTALILGYMNNGENLKALEVFNCMDCQPDRVTLSAALKACGSVGAFETGQRIHKWVRELGLEEDEMLATSLVDFYAKSSNMVAAEDVFKRKRTQDTVSWTALIGGYSSLGDTSKVFTTVKRMQDCGVKLNGVTMQMILTACSHAGLVDEAQSYFESMPKLGISPTVEHYACMVDMLGRANRLEEALCLVRGMPVAADSVVWIALLGACRKWSNVEFGRAAFNALVALDQDKESVAAAHVLMRNILQEVNSIS